MTNTFKTITSQRKVQTNKLFNFKERKPKRILVYSFYEKSIVLGHFFNFFKFLRRY